MKRVGRIQVEELAFFELRPAPSSQPVFVTRDAARLLALALTLTIHSLAIEGLLLGSGPNKAHRPAAGGSLRPQGEDLVLISLADNSQASPDAGTPSFLAPEPIRMAVAIPEPELLSSEIEGSTADSELSEQQTTPAEGDPRFRALMFARYSGQIRARIERAWTRPREWRDANKDGGAVTLSGKDQPAFRCRVQIRQDERGNVKETLLLSCNGTSDWKQSLVTAINQASPLPAPPTPKVFTRALTITFEARAYGRPDDYDLDRKVDAGLF